MEVTIEISSISVNAFVGWSYVFKGNFSLRNRPFYIRLILPGVQWRRSVGGSDEGGDGPNSQLSTGDFPDFLSRFNTWRMGSQDEAKWLTVNNHRDRVCPQDLGLWDPFQMAIHGLEMGVTNCLQVLGWSSKQAQVDSAAPVTGYRSASNCAFAFLFSTEFEEAEISNSTGLFSCFVCSFSFPDSPLLHKFCWNFPSNWVSQSQMRRRVPRVFLMTGCFFPVFP